MGCRGITPGMVGLAKKFQDEPFEVIASYCQRGTKDPALQYLKSQGWSEEMKNVSVTYQTRYPDDVPIKYVPYYLIFDHTGKLRYHHMAGPYHGGNGDKYQEQVAALLKETPRKKPEGPLTKMRTWSNEGGKKLEAELLDVVEGKARFRMKNGRVVDYPLEKLSEKSRKEIEELTNG